MLGRTLATAAVEVAADLDVVAPMTREHMVVVEVEGVQVELGAGVGACGGGGGGGGKHHRGG